VIEDGPAPNAVDSKPIRYHGGTLINAAGNSVNVYLIFYGSLHRGGQTSGLIHDFVEALGGQPWQKINTTYYNARHDHLGSHVKLQGTAYFGAKYGSKLGGKEVRQLVADAVHGGFPRDANGVYIVLTSGGIDGPNGMCSQFCGY